MAIMQMIPSRFLPKRNEKGCLFYCRCSCRCRVQGLRFVLFFSTSQPIHLTLFSNAAPSNHSEITRFSMSDDHPAFGQIDGPPTPLPTSASIKNRAFQELPKIQPLRSLNSMMGFQYSKTQLRSPVKPNGRRFECEERETPTFPAAVGGMLRASGMKTATVAVPREALLTVQRREPHDQV